MPNDTQIEALKVPPHSIEAEQSVLGGLLLDNGHTSVTLIKSGGVERVLSGGLASFTVVSSGGEQDVFSGGLASGTDLRFRGKQVRDWVYTKLVADPAGMTNLSRADRDLLAARAEFAISAIARRQDSADGTQKLLLTRSQQRKQ